jgi:tetratricopeptide (TPR) repeat protein
MDYLVYAYLQLGQDAKAREVVEEMNAVPGVNPNLLGGAYALAAAPARYMIERNDWNGAAELQVRATSLAHVEAITRFARALGAARIGKSDAAKMDIAKLAELRDKLREARDAYWSEQVDIQWQIANAWVLYAERKYEDALKSMSAAADAENRTEKHPVTPGVPKPANELYGVMLLDRGLAREALAAFEATMKKEPNRLNAFVGAAKAADMQGDKEKARTYYQRLASLASGTEADRPELVAAQQYLTKN